MKAVKFNFDTNFDASQASQTTGARAEQERLRSAFDAGHQEGYTQGQAAAEEAANAASVALIAQIAEGVAALLEERKAVEDRIEKDAVQVAFTIARKLAAAAIAERPTAEIENLVRDCLETCREETRLVVRVADDMTDVVASICEQIKARTTFAGEVIVVGDPAIGVADCIVEWPDGGAERRLDQVARTIEGMVQNFMMGRGPEPMAQAAAGAQAHQPPHATDGQTGPQGPAPNPEMD